jgi:AraC-like DNA-binding protein
VNSSAPTNAGMNHGLMMARSIARAPLCLIAVLRDAAWIRPDTGDPVRLRPGDVAIVRGPEPYTVADSPTTRPQVVIHPGERCTTPDGEDLHLTMDLGVRTWGTSLDGRSVLLVGTYLQETEIGRRLLTALPHLVVLSVDSPLIPLLSEEIARDEPGQEAVLDRLLDLLLISVLRAWFGRPDADVPAWYRANGDPVVGKALRMLHNNPARPWTVAELAARAGVSRAALARRFTDIVGEPPMAYLTGWRLALAADLLRDPAATIGSVARQVGYGSPFALSAAFKRVRGASPRAAQAGATGIPGAH